ncbi:MAG: 2-C-methyl-D-erythritol 4-phosphate cytidylyltransferase [Phycisphaerales bacterium]|nr:2-C-methyl-D-erythritol 4-phosphate cytidylyltransferase [Phycisphaerales bacterium]
MKIAVIIPAAGNSTRFNGCGQDADLLGMGRSKLDEDLGGKTVLQRAIELFNTHEHVCQVIVAGPHDPEAMSNFKLRHADRINLLGGKLVTGGKDHRWQSVESALAVVADEATHVAIHDAARPATPPELVDRVFDAAARFDAVIPVIPVSDTLKRISPESIDDKSEDDPLAAILGAGDAIPMHAVVGGIDREDAVLVQTPQVFAKDLIVRAYQQDDLSSTDDAGLIQRLGEEVVTVAGDERNMKLTRQGDLPILRAVMKVHTPKARPSNKRF